jgi:hypothetical protein
MFDHWVQNMLLETGKETIRTMNDLVMCEFDSI